MALFCRHFSPCQRCLIRRFADAAAPFRQRHYLMAIITLVPPPFDAALYNIDVAMRFRRHADKAQYRKREKKGPGGIN